jgi:hypothetical protein
VPKLEATTICACSPKECRPAGPASLGAHIPDPTTSGEVPTIIFHTAIFRDKHFHGRVLVQGLSTRSLRWSHGISSAAKFFLKLATTVQGAAVPRAWVGHVMVKKRTSTSRYAVFFNGLLFHVKYST